MKCKRIYTWLSSILKKAFDTNIRIKILDEIGLDKKDIRLIINIYWAHKAIVELGVETTDWFVIKRRVRKGCILSPDLFSLNGQKCMEDIDGTDGIKIGGRTQITLSMQMILY